MANSIYDLYRSLLLTRYEPIKSSGIVHLPPRDDPDGERDLFAESLDSYSLHELGSLFSFLRNRVSYADRPGRIFLGETDGDRRTTTQRLGLARGRVALEMKI